MNNSSIIDASKEDGTSPESSGVKLAMPLFFIKYHIHINLLRDRSETRRVKERARRLLGKIVGKVFLAYLALCIFLPFIFFGLYLIKSWLGIDIFSDYHLSDFIPFLE